MRATSSRRDRRFSLEKLQRSEILLAHQDAIRIFGDFGIALCKVPLLRVYWYDGTSTGPTPQHLSLAHLHDVKVRLGFVNSVGEQKGVDSLIITDMINLARNRAISDAVLVSGDEDLRVGVQQAQEFGVRVHLLGIKPSRGSQSLSLLQEADTTHEWSAEEVGAFLKCHPRPIPAEPVNPEPPPVAADAGTRDWLNRVAGPICAVLELTEIGALVEAFERTRQLPREIDGKLLAGGRRELGRDLEPTEKKWTRECFIESCRKRIA